MRALVGAQGVPEAPRLVPGGALRRLRLVLQIGVGLLVGRDDAGAGAALDRHVADRHAAFHGQRPDRLAGIFEHVAGAAGGADLADDGEDDVLGGDAGRQHAVDAHAHVLGLALDQRLRRQDVLDLGGADAVRQRPEGAVRRGVAVAAHDGGARQGEALLRADDVDDALAAVELVVIFEAEIAGVLGERLDLGDAFRVLVGLRAVGGRDVVIDDREGLLGVAHLAAAQAQALEGLRARHLVDEVAVDIEEAGAVRLPVDDVVVPDLVVERARRHGRVILSIVPEVGASLVPSALQEKCRVVRPAGARRYSHRGPARLRWRRTEHDAEKHVLELDPRMEPHRIKSGCKLFGTPSCSTYRSRSRLCVFDWLNQNAS